MCLFPEHKGKLPNTLSDVQLQSINESRKQLLNDIAGDNTWWNLQNTASKQHFEKIQEKLHPQIKQQAPSSEDCAKIKRHYLQDVRIRELNLQQEKNAHIQSQQSEKARQEFYHSALGRAYIAEQQRIQQEQEAARMAQLAKEEQARQAFYATPQGQAYLAQQQLIQQQQALQYQQQQYEQQLLQQQKAWEEQQRRQQAWQNLNNAISQANHTISNSMNNTSRLMNNISNQMNNNMQMMQYWGNRNNSNGISWY